MCFALIYGQALAFYASLSLYGLHATVTQETHDGVMRHTGDIGNQAPGSKHQTAILCVFRLCRRTWEFVTL